MRASPHALTVKLYPFRAVLTVLTHMTAVEWKWQVHACLRQVQAFVLPSTMHEYAG
jgi:hypothetical protein